MTSPLRGLDDHVKCRPYASAVPRKNGVLNKYFGAKMNTWTLKEPTFHLSVIQLVTLSNKHSKL